MLRWYWEHRMGTLTIHQKQNEKVKTFKINIYMGNCLAVMLYEKKDENGEEMYQLYNFFIDENDLKRRFKGCHKLIWDEVVSIRLNLYYKECQTLLKYFTKEGHKVICYYKEPKEK